MDLNFLQDPAETFRNWSVKREEPVPAHVHWLYVSVLGFYIQALLSCLFLGKSNLWYQIIGIIFRVVSGCRKI